MPPAAAYRSSAATALPRARRALCLSLVIAALGAAWLDAASVPPSSAAGIDPLADLTRWGTPDAGQGGQPGPCGLSAYDGRLRMCRYTLEVLTPGSLAGVADRTQSHFHVDPFWPVEFRATPADYRALAGAYDRGHLMAAANHAGSQAEMDETFALSNIAPQDPALNRGLMRQLEADLQSLAQDPEVAAIWVATLVLFMPADAPDRGQPTAATVTLQFAGPNHIPIPTHFAKTALFLSTRGQVSLRSWCFPNRPPDAAATLDAYRCTVDYLEHWSGLDFWPALPEPQQARLEATE